MSDTDRVFRLERRLPSSATTWGVIMAACAVIGGGGVAFWLTVASPRLDAWRAERAAEAAHRFVTRQAENIVRERLDAPSSARFVETTILEEVSGLPFSRYLIMTKVDAQNALGVFLRGHFCVVLYSEGTKVFWNKEYGLVDCKKEGEWTPYYAEAFKRINGWNEPVPRVDASAP